MGGPEVAIARRPDTDPNVGVVAQYVRPVTWAVDQGIEETGDRATPSDILTGSRPGW